MANIVQTCMIICMASNTTSFLERDLSLILRATLEVKSSCNHMNKKNGAKKCRISKCKLLQPRFLAK